MPSRRAPKTPPPSDGSPEPERVPVAASRARLLDWYDANARDLPWRRTRDPYAIWVSEVMLQQTRVDTVIPYFERFLERFPTMVTLAAASEDEVLAAFRGLGYYRRARLLHRGVAEAVERYGEVPREAAARRALPGIGAYTAGAIGSIAFGLPEPIVDGNVARVLARAHRIETPLGRADTTARAWALAAHWAEGERPGHLNQALMELGATVCTPAAPQCTRCPLAETCLARAHGDEARLPIAATKTAPVAKELAAAVLRGPDGGLVFHRSEAALFGGLWGVPMVEGGLAELEAHVGAFATGAVFEPASVGTMRHVLSHRVMTVRVHVGHAASVSALARWVDPAAPGELGFSRLTEKVLAAAGVELAGSRPAVAARAARIKRPAPDVPSGDGAPRAPSPTRAPARSPRSKRSER